MTKEVVSKSGLKGVCRFKVNPICDICLNNKVEYIISDYKIDSQGLLYFEYECVCSNCLVENFNIDKQVKF